MSIRPCPGVEVPELTAGGAGQQPRRDDGDVGAGPTRRLVDGRGLRRLVSCARPNTRLRG